MRKAFRVSALVLALAASTYAGEMQFGVTQPPPPPPSAPTLAQIVITLFSLF